MNLEGITYANWPIARLIERELGKPQLPALASTMVGAGEVEVNLNRDAWQASSRVRIREQRLMPPTRLSLLAPVAWRTALTEALGCLDEGRGYRGRRKVTVTLAASGQQVERAVSPHLSCLMALDTRGPHDRIALGEALKRTRALMQPIYDWMVGQAR